MNLIALKQTQLAKKHHNLVSHLFNPKLTGEDVLKEIIRTSNQLKGKLKQDTTQLTNFYSGLDFQKLLHNQIQQNSFLHEQSKLSLSNQTISRYTSPSVVITKPTITPMEQYLTFKDFETYSQLPQDTKFAQ
jgi:hypothetical protein